MLFGEGRPKGRAKQTTPLQTKDKTELREKHKPQLPQDILVPRDGGHAPLYLITTTKGWPPANCRQNPD